MATLNKEMNVKEMNLNEMETVSGGQWQEEVVEYLHPINGSKKIIDEGYELLDEGYKIYHEFTDEVHEVMCDIWNAIF